MLGLSQRIMCSPRVSNKNLNHLINRITVDNGKRKREQLSTRDATPTPTPTPTTRAWAVVVKVATMLLITRIIWNFCIKIPKWLEFFPNIYLRLPAKLSLFLSVHLLLLINGYSDIDVYFCAVLYVFEDSIRLVCFEGFVIWFRCMEKCNRNSERNLFWAN